MLSRFLLHHRHEARHCGAAYAAFKGHASPLRRRDALTSCRTGAHDIWWLVDAESAEEALNQLPHFVAVRTTATRITRVRIP